MWLVISLFIIFGLLVNCKGKIKEGKIFFVLKLFNLYWFYNFYVNVKNRINFLKKKKMNKKGINGIEIWLVYSIRNICLYKV